ncbi:pyrroline-5-carboxylate reductase [soil metagenome]
MPPHLPHLVIIGGGTMGSLIARAAAKAGAARAVTVIEPDAVKRRRLGREGVRTAVSVTEFAGAADSLLLRATISKRGEARPTRATQTCIFLLAVKPQMFAGLVPELSPVLARGDAVLSIMAGVRSGDIARALHIPRSAVARAMPNLGIRVGFGMTALAFPTRGSPALRRSTRGLFLSVGEVVELPEARFDAFTAFAGSGPAYFFYLAEALERAGAALGFPAPLARQVSMQLAQAAAAMLAEPGASAARLRSAVTSKAGVTAAACTVLDDRNIRAAFTSALKAGVARGRELAGAAPGAQAPAIRSRVTPDKRARTL